MSRLAIGLREIGPVLARRQRFVLRPASSPVFRRLEPGRFLWLAEPFHLERAFDGFAPTVALARGATPVFAADLREDPAAAAALGQRHPARSLCRQWHRFHVRVTARTELRLQALAEADLAAMGFAARDLFAAHWDCEAALIGARNFRWRDNPTVLRFGFELLAGQLPGTAPLPDLAGVNAPLRGRTPPAPPPPVPPAEPRRPLPLAEAARAFAERYEEPRHLSATARNPLALPPRPVRRIAAPAPTLPSLAERENGTCARCGSRLAYGCEHHPLQESAA